MEGRFLNALVCHLPFDGWSEASIQAAAQDAGISETEINRMFPGGIADVISAANAMNDRNMCAVFMERYGADFDEMPVHRRIREMIIIRLELFQTQKDVIRRTMSFMARPDMAKLGSRLLYRTLDAMWRLAGDRSTDFNFYTKRATLAAVYGSTLLAFLGDDSPDMAQTKAFLDRRLKDIGTIPKVTRPVKQMADAAFSLVRRFASGPQGRTGQ